MGKVNRCRIYDERSMFSSQIQKRIKYDVKVSASVAPKVITINSGKRFTVTLSYVYDLGWQLVECDTETSVWKHNLLAYITTIWLDQPGKYCPYRATGGPHDRTDCPIL